MIKYLIAFLLIASTCIAGMGIGGFPQPGPGVVVGAVITEPYYSDDFNRANGNLTTPWVSNTVRPIPQILSEKLYSTNNTGVGIYGSMPSDTYKVCAVIVTASTTQGGPVVRASTTAYTQYDFFPSSASNIRLRRTVAASSTILQDTPMTMNDGDKVCLHVSGASPVILTGYVNGSQVVQYEDSSASRLSSGSNVGVMIYSGNVDDWSAYEN